jgi:hypothetical protein
MTTGWLCWTSQIGSFSTRDPKRWVHKEKHHEKNIMESFPHISTVLSLIDVTALANRDAATASSICKSNDRTLTNTKNNIKRSAYG